MLQRSGNMESFIFNEYKYDLLNGKIADKNVWTFHIVNKNFAEDLGDILPKLGHKGAVDSYIFATDKNVESRDVALSKYESVCTPVNYTYKVSQNTLSSERPSYVDIDNWNEFNSRYKHQSHLYSLFFAEGGLFRRTYTTDEIDPVTNTYIERVRGFYYVETAEELKWCAEKVNGLINGSRSEIYNNYINIVLGDNLGYGKADSTNRKHIDFSIGAFVDRPFEGIFYGNGYIIQNVVLECNSNSSGLIGYLGKSGIIDTIRVKGHNVLKCNKKININHMIDTASDINAGFLCGKNNGRICNVSFNGSVTLVDFVPGVYAVSNKTDDDGNAFDNPGENIYFPDYLCINSIANIVPYIGYFGEGVFSTWANEGRNKGYWKSNNVYAGDVGQLTGAANVSNFYPYDNSSCAEWAYPSAASNDTYEVTGHTLFYNINAMFETNQLLTDEQGDWSEYLSMLKYTSSMNGNKAIHNWEIQSTQYMDKSIKMHQFNRVSYNTGLLIGCNEGDVSSIVMNASAYTSGTYVGFLGGIAGKQATSPKMLMDNICVNLYTCDVDDNRQKYISDDGDMLSYTGNTSTTFTFVSDNLCYGTYSYGSKHSLLKTQLFGGDKVVPNGQAKLNVGGTNGDGTYNWGDASVIRLNLNGYSGIQSGTLTHVFSIPYQTFDAVEATYDYRTANGINYGMPDNQKVDIYTKYLPAADMYTRLMASSAYSGTVTGFNNVTSSYSAMHFGAGEELAIIGFEQRSKPVGILHPNSVGIVYKYGRYGHDGSLTNDFKNNIIDGDTAGDCTTNMLEINEPLNTKYENGINYTDSSLFAVYNINPSANVYDSGNNLVGTGGAKLGAIFSVSGAFNSNDSDTKIVSCRVGKFLLEFKERIDIPSNRDRQIYKAFGTYGTHNYSYNTFNIIGAQDVEFTIVRQVDTGLQEGRRTYRYEYYTLKIPEILNKSKIGGKKFTNKESGECFIANYENPYNSKPVVSYMLEHYTFDGCKNYNIKLKSIKNIGAMFGSLVLGTQQNMSNISAYLYNGHKNKFEHYINQRAYEAGPITDLGNVVNISAFDVANSGNSGCFFYPANLSAIGNKTGYFETSANPGQAIVKVKCADYNGEKYGYYSDVDGFSLSGGIKVGLINKALMYAYDSVAYPALDDYSFDNRFAPFAAVCEFNSCNISDKYCYTLPETLTAVQPYINFHNVNCVYHEAINDYNIYAAYRRFGPMYLANKIQGFAIDGSAISAEPTYSFGIALPFIAEIKPTYIAIPSIIESPLCNGEYGNADTSAAFKRIGMFTMDQNFAAPTNDPNFWSINLGVDLPGIAGIIDRNETSNQVMDLYGFELNNNNHTYERGKTVGNLLDHLFNMEEVSINNGNYGYFNTTTNTRVSGDGGYGRFGNQTFYAEVSNMTKLGFDSQSANNTSVNGGYYTQNKVLAPGMYFGSNVSLVLHGYSGYNSQKNMTIVNPNYYNPKSIGEFCCYYTPVTSKKQGAKVLPTTSFSTSGIKTGITMLNEWIKDPSVSAYYVSLKGNCIKADIADTYRGTDKFKYNYTKTVLDNAKFTSFKQDVQLDERNDKYGFWFMDSLKEKASVGNRSKYYNGKNDEIRYDGSTLHIGAMFSEKCILENLRVDSYITAASGIMCDDLGGLYVTDREGRNVMYIDISMGECDGSRSWTMPCSAAGTSGGLIMEIE